jgi:anti-anti-sigma regulatory factor
LAQADAVVDECLVRRGDPVAPRGRLRLARGRLDHSPSPSRTLSRERKGMTVHVVVSHAEGRNVEEIVQLDGVFDAWTAHALRSRLNGSADDKVFVVDFSRVDGFEDFALAVLAQGLAPEAHKRVTLRGLNRRQERILRYFGINRVEPAQETRDVETR